MFVGSCYSLCVFLILVMFFIMDINKYLLLLMIPFIFTFIYQLKLFDSHMVETEGTPGLIINTSNKGIVVAANGGGIQIQRVRPHDAGKIAAHEFVENYSLSVGANFGS